MHLTKPRKQARYPSWRYREHISFKRSSHEALLASVERWCHERDLPFNINEYIRHLVWEDRDGQVTSPKEQEE